MDTYIKNKTIIVCNNDTKKDILTKLNNTLLSIKFFSIEEIVKSVFFSYDIEAIYFIMKKYNIKYEIAKIYLENIIYINDKPTTKKLSLLKEIKDSLKENNLLIFDDLFIPLIKNYDQLIVIGYDYLTKIQKEALEQIKKYINVEIIENKTNNYKPEVLKLPTISDEVEYVAKKISKLITDGIDINNIKITNISEDYYDEIEKTFKLYKLPININNKINLFSTKVGALFLKNYSSNLEDTLNILKEQIDLNNEINLNIYNSIINIINDYTFIEDKNEVKELIINDLKKNNFKIFDYKNNVEIVDFKHHTFKDNEYVFMLNFNLNNIPINYKDEEFISDKEKSDLLLETSIEKNKQEKDMVINKVKSIKNLIITFKEKTPFEKYYPSSIIDELDLHVISETLDPNESYSQLADKLNLSKQLDNLIKYGIIAPDLDIYYNTYKEIPYLKYNNSYTGIDKKLLKTYLGDKLLLSYSTMDNYYRCSFKYYLANILKLDIFEEKFSTFVGSLFHHILELGLETDINIDWETTKYIRETKKELTSKEMFFLEKLKKELSFIIEIIKKQKTYSELNNVLYEDKTYIQKEMEIPVIFSGITDKLLYKEENGMTIIAIIDYKTGNPDIDLRLNKYGIGMQLPIYLYLAKNNKKFTNPVFAGFYLQKILNNEINIEPDKTYEQLKENNLKLSGYSTTNKDILAKFDNTYSSSLLINSLKTKNDGDFYNYSKVLTDNQISAIINNVDNKITEAAKNIIDAKFDINPKKIGFGKTANVGCEYCKFKDICFMTDKDYKYLEEVKDLSYLGGEDNA